MTSTARTTTAKKTSAAAKKPVVRSRARTAARKSTGVVRKPVKMAAATARKAKPAKAKAEKTKMIRDSFSLSEADYAVLIALKKKCIASDVPVKKSELVRLGLQTLSKMGQPALLAAAKRMVAGRK